MFISPAYAQDAAGIMASVTQFAPLLLIFGVFYFLLIRPQQTRAKEMKAMLSALRATAEQALHLSVHNISLTRLERVAEGWRVVCVNEWPGM